MTMTRCGLVVIAAPARFKRILEVTKTSSGAYVMLSDRVKGGPSVATPAEVASNIGSPETVQSPSTAEIQAWLVEYFARALEVDPQEVDVTIPFERYGLSSATAFEMMGDLQEWLETRFDPTLPYDFPTIAKLSKQLAILVNRLED
jgi:acyl carrier protein